MTTPSQPAGPDSNQSLAENERPSDSSSPGHSRRGRRIALAFSAGLIVVAAVQSYAASWDYQTAFLVCLAVSLATAAVVLYQLQRWAIERGRGWTVPVGVVALVVSANVLWRIETLSGEMIPQITWRFSSKQVPAIRRTPALSPDDASPRHDVAPGNEVPAGNEVPGGALRTAGTEQPAGQDESSSVRESGATPRPVRWGGFLGNDRSGVLPKRTFAIPGDPAEVAQRWSIGIGGGWSSFAVAGDVAVTLEQRGDRECVAAYRMTDGELLWLVDHVARHYHPLGEGGPRSTPAISGGRVFAQGATGRLWCLDLASGREIWTRDLLQLGGWAGDAEEAQNASEASIAWGRAGSPLIVDDLCVIPLGGPEEMPSRSLVALDVETGEVRWTAGEDQISYASPQQMVFDGVPQIVSVNEATITGHDVSTGQVLWSFDWYGRSNTGANCAAAVDAGEDRFLIGKGYGGGSALVKVSRGGEGGGTWRAESVWLSGRLLKTKFTHAVVSDGVAYALSNGALQAVDVDSGRRLWEQPRRGRFGQGQVLLAGDTLVVQAEEGEVALVQASRDEYRELVRLPALQHKTWNIPTLVDNVLLVRNDQQAIALELPPREVGQP